MSIIRFAPSCPDNYTGRGREDNGWRYAAYRINITNFSVYKYTILIHVNIIFTTNCGMQYERVLATELFSSVRQGRQAY